MRFIGITGNRPLMVFMLYNITATFFISSIFYKLHRVKKKDNFARVSYRCKVFSLPSSALELIQAER
jgi:hypothetical protein